MMMQINVYCCVLIQTNVYCILLYLQIKTNVYCLLLYVLILMFIVYCWSELCPVFFTGMRDNQQIRFSGEGDQEPDYEPGDIIIVLDEQEHEKFRRRGNDLVMTMQLELVEALCGFQKTIQTLDGRTLVVTSMPGL